MTPSATDGGMVCDDFAGYPVGAQPTDWTAVAGSWRIVDVSNGQHALGQMNTRMTGRALIWNGTATGDVIVSATVRSEGNTATDCLITRYHDENNYYAWCIANGTDWMLVRMKQGRTNNIDAGKITYDPAQPHALVFRALGTQLTGSVDGMQLSQQNDQTFEHGGVALSTDNRSSFANVCITPL
jgi:hypothetical protein